MAQAQVCFRVTNQTCSSSKNLLFHPNSFQFYSRNVINSFTVRYESSSCCQLDHLKLVLCLFFLCFCIPTQIYKTIFLKFSLYWSLSSKSLCTTCTNDFENELHYSNLLVEAGNRHRQSSSLNSRLFVVVLRVSCLTESVLLLLCAVLSCLLLCSHSNSLAPSDPGIFFSPYLGFRWILSVCAVLFVNRGQHKKGFKENLKSR